MHACTLYRLINYFYIGFLLIYSIDFFFSDKIVTLQNASVELNKTIKILIHTKTCVAKALCWLWSFPSQISHYFFSFQWTKNLQFLLLVAPIGYFLSICSNIVWHMTYLVCRVGCESHSVIDYIFPIIVFTTNTQMLYFP